MHVKKGNLATNISNDRFYYRFSWIHLARPMTFTGTVSPILVGTAFAAQNGEIRFDIFLALFTAALLIQAATNMFNDYFDFLHGQDEDKWTNTECQESVHSPPHHLIPYVASTILAIAVLIGSWLAFQSSLWIILIGILGMSAGFAYSAGSHSFSSIGLGETVAAIFLGFVPAILAYIVQGHSLNGQILVIAAPFASLIATMILTNNLRDIEKDLGFRKTVAIMIGKVNGIRLLTLLLCLVYLSIIGLIFFHVMPWTTGLVLFALPLAIRLRWSFRLHAKRIEEIKAMKLAAVHHWVFSLFFILGMLIG